MAVIYLIQVTCTNKLCRYETEIGTAQEWLTEKGFCPKCGFKTLDETSTVKLYQMLSERQPDGELEM